MSIVNAKKIINGLENKINDLKLKYSKEKFVTEEFIKLIKQSKIFETYLSNLDQLKPNYNTNEIDSHMNAVTLHLDLLKERLEKKDYTNLLLRVKLLKTMFKFHPTKYSPFAYITAWFYEWLYFI